MFRIILVAALLVGSNAYAQSLNCLFTGLSSDFTQQEAVALQLKEGVFAVGSTLVAPKHTYWVSLVRDQNPGQYRVSIRIHGSAKYLFEGKLGLVQSHQEKSGKATRMDDGEMVYWSCVEAK